MSETGTTPPGDAGTPSSAESGSSSAPPPAPGGHDPLRGSRTSGVWASVIVLAIVLLLLAIFILQNTQKVSITYLGWDGEAPLAAALLIAAVAGAFVVASAGALRIVQLRRRVKRDRKAERRASK